ncbi:hypothetical protein E5Q_05422 [Mixia osmundae IAM 14324]|uniref:mRNA-capping enzyme subunit beta n=1 Tax=Mixia osmundae (strain CBS 9802 / IAM 14324 / JCM 22182 / KY 12970) TaxID=764103 RepID=G7E7C4_MIXOS|nr:hypothetical protein E5Q_05422 [Mixia osmundae IAM 14324]
MQPGSDFAPRYGPASPLPSQLGASQATHSTTAAPALKRTFDDAATSQGNPARAKRAMNGSAAHSEHVKQQDTALVSPSSSNDSLKPPKNNEGVQIPPAISELPLDGTIRPLEASMLGLAPIDEFTREVADWIWAFTRTLENVEIEAKLGTLIDNRTQARIIFPVAVETILTDASTFRFESNMTVQQHGFYNQMLNTRFAESNKQEYDGERIQYVHTRHLDSIHSFPSDNFAKLRVTTDQKTGQVVPNGVIIKRKVADMNVYCPKRSFDYRISVSIESPTVMPTDRPSRQRYKDRLSYRHQITQIDLTQVKSPETIEPRHELELELTPTDLIMQEGAKQAAGQPSLYRDMIQVFLNNIRMLRYEHAQEMISVRERRRSIICDVRLGNVAIEIGVALFDAPWRNIASLPAICSASGYIIALFFDIPYHARVGAKAQSQTESHQEARKGLSHYSGSIWRSVYHWRELWRLSGEQLTALANHLAIYSQPFSASSAVRSSPTTRNTLLPSKFMSRIRVGTGGEISLGEEFPGLPPLSVLEHLRWIADVRPGTLRAAVGFSVSGQHCTQKRSASALPRASPPRPPDGHLHDSTHLAHRANPEHTYQTLSSLAQGTHSTMRSAKVRASLVALHPLITICRLLDD